MTMPISVKKKDGGRVAGPYNVPSVLEVRVQMALPNGKLSYWTVHGTFTTTPPSIQTVATALFGSLSGAWNTSVAPLCATTTQFQNVYVRDMTSSANPIFTGTGPAVLGTSASPAMPVNAAIVLTEQIASRGRGLKGRIFMGGFATNADAGGGTISSVAQTNLEAFCVALFNAIQGQSLTPCVAQPPRAQYQGITGTVHPARGTIGPPAVGTHVAVSAYVLRDTIWDTQRRRIQA